MAILGTATSAHAKDTVGALAAPPRIGVLTADGTALVKEGGLSATWVTEYHNTIQLALSTGTD